jgi:hypothetical protein
MEAYKKKFYEYQNNYIIKRIILKKKESPLISIIINIAIPVIILYKFSNEKYLGPTYGFILAFAFPLIYGIYDFISKRKFSFISALGVLNVLLTGGIGLLKIDNKWLAVKEASVPALIGLIVLISMKTKYPLIRTILYNDVIIDTMKINEELDKRQNHKSFDILLNRATILLSLSFFLSSILNYTLAKIIVKSIPGTIEYNHEIGRMTMLSYPVIVVPSMIVVGFTLWYIISGIKKLAGFGMEEILKTNLKTEKK